MKITFLGAAGEVTGSQHLIETPTLRLLLDCGLFQGARIPSRQKNEVLRCDPKSLDVVVLSHAHIDHCGNLPSLYRAGYRGPVYCTPATADVAAVMLEDSCRIQQEDARYLSRKLEPGHPSVEPLYGDEDVRGLISQFEPKPYQTWCEIGKDLRLRFHDAGHILGSAIVELEIEDAGEVKRVVFTGDLGRRNVPLLRDPATVGTCDALIIESTYADKVHLAVENIKHELLRIMQEAVLTGGRVIIPAFSLGRTQNLIYVLNELFNEGLLPRVPVFVDSPLSLKLTKVYRRHARELDSEVHNTLDHGDSDAFGFPGLTFIQTQQESQALNKRRGAMVIIAAGGMCESGRVVHHLKHGVSDPNNTIAIIGYQAEHTLGRQLVERRSSVRIFDRWIPLRAHVEALSGLSAHADAADFKWWLGAMHSAGGCNQSFVVHGEDRSRAAMVELLKDVSGEPPVTPQFGQTYEV